MKSRARIHQFFLFLLWLWLLLPNTAAYAAPQKLAENPDDKRTMLIVQAPATIHAGENAALIARLTTTQGQLIAGVDIELVMDTIPAQRARTDADGAATFRLPSKLAEGDYTLKVIFAGAPSLRTAIVVAQLRVEAPQLVEPTTQAEPTIQATPTSSVATQAPAPQPSPTLLPAPTVLPRATDTGAKQVITTTDSTMSSAEAKFLTNKYPSVALTTLKPGVHAIALAPNPQRSTLVSAARIQTTALAVTGLQLAKTQVMSLLANVRNTLKGYPGAQPVMAFGALLLLLFVASPALRTNSRRLPSLFRLRNNHLARPSRQMTPISVWYGLRMIGLGITLGLVIVLFVRPATGLFFFWHAFIPTLPLLFFVAPGFWRNVCPMATLNQTPRLFHFTRALTLPKWLQEYGYVIAISLFLILASSRKVIFNQNGPALAVLILVALAGAFVMGNFFKGKSGWCSSMCPLLPVQRIYGQTPFVNIPNAHCEPCIGCTKNCYDFNPKVAYLADLADPDRHFAAYRKFFVGLFPGFILAFYLLPNPPALSFWQMYMGFAIVCLISLGTFFAVETFVKATSNQLTVLYGALALNFYYWFNAPTLGDLIGTPALLWFVWPLRVLIFGLTLIWVYRTYQKEPQFIELMLTSKVSQVSVNAPSLANQPARVMAPEVRVEPEGKCLTATKNRTLLEIVEQNNLPIEAGCRMGVCGADPVCILDGMDNLSKIGSEERATLERLGLAPNTRMACMARVRGDVKISLTPAKPEVFLTSIVAGFRYEKTVERVVIIGNGIAGVTAADHIRRRHPKCEIHLIGRERHHLYNRMGITRLIYGRSAMQGLYLLPDQWYEDFNITCWLNTHVTKVDAQARQVVLGTGDTLPYDRLILTTGSQSYLPKIEGYPMTGGFVLREAEDAMAIRAFVQAQVCRSAVVAGGGLLGLEAAYGLQRLGLTVTVLERSNSLLRRQLDIRGGQFLHDYLEKLGIHIVMEAEAASVQDSVQELVQRRGQTDLSITGRIQQVTLKDGRTLPCDLLLVAAGIRSEIELARSIGLAVGQGVIVDAQMRTSDPAIFAAGDVAEFDGRIYGLWPVAVSQAEVAATNAVAGPGATPATYTETPPVTMLKVVGVDLTSIGRIEPQSDRESVIALEESAEYRYRKLVIADGKIVGAILLGYPLEAPGVIEAVKQQLDITPYLTALQAGDWQVLSELA